MKKIAFLFVVLALLAACSDDSPTAPRIVAGFSASCYAGVCSFNNTSTGGNYAVWTPGDGSPQVASWNLTHDYVLCDDFIVSVRVCPKRDSSADRCDVASGRVFSCP